MISGYRSGTAVEVNLVDKPDERISAKYYGVDKDGISTLEISLVAGQDFSGIEAQDSVSVIINQTAADLYGGHEVSAS